MTTARRAGKYPEAAVAPDDMENKGFGQEFINSLADAVIVIDREGRVSMVNEALLALQRDARENIVGKPCHEVLHLLRTRCDRPEHDCPFQEVFETGRPMRAVHRHFTQDGAEMVVEIIASPLRNDAGEITHMLEVMRDITAERHLHGELRRSHDLLTSVLEGIGEGVVVVDRDYRILSANAAYLHQMHTAREDIIGKRCHEVSHHFASPCGERGHDCPVREVFETGLPAQAMHTHYDQAGEPVYVEVRSYPIRDQSGAVIRAIETLTDVTERVKLTQQVRESEEKYRDLYDNAPDGYYTIDGNGVIVEVNRTFLDMTGYSRGELIGKMCLDSLLLSDSARVCHAMFPVFIRTGRISNLELMMTRKDGTVFPVALNARALHDADGRMLLGRVVIRDITDRKTADEERRKLQQQLFQAQKLEALGTLAGGIAHDFNNLLSSIMGYASLAKADLPPDHPVFRHVDIIETASIRAAELTHQLLAFARGGKFKVKPNDINAIVLEVVAILSRTIEKNITVEVRTAEGLKPAVCDAGQVQQAIMNVCINARDAMPGGGRLVIETAPRLVSGEEAKTLVDVKAGEYVSVSVADTGSGMDKETQEHMFDPFFTTKEHGTGLGLSMVYGIIRKHGGFVQVSSEPGKGSTFRVMLPACGGGPECAQQGDRQEFRRGSGTVLVVDDEPLINDLARDILERYGYTVLTAGGGADGVATYAERRAEISLVLLDMVMPEMDGREVFRRIREMNPGARIIVSSGYSHDRDADDLLKKGASAFVQKPYRMAELLRTVEQVMEG